jgi:hypothetical protein
MSNLSMIVCALGIAARLSAAGPVGDPQATAAAGPSPEPLVTQSAAVGAQAAAPAPLKIGGLTISGSVRVRVEDWHWFDTSAAEPDYTFAAPLLRFALSQQTKKFDWQVEGAFPWLINLPTNSIAPAPQGQLGLGAAYYAANGGQDGSAVLKQGFVRVNGLGRDTPSRLRLGRFEFVDGAETTPGDATLATLKRDQIAHRLIGPFTFSHVGRAFDGVHYARITKASDVTFVAARPTAGVFDLDANPELDVDFYYGAFTRSHAGARVDGDARVFALHYHDGRSVLKADNRPQAVRQADTETIRMTTIGGHYLGAIDSGAGTLDVLVWGAGQFGRWGPLDHRAAAIAIEGGYQIPIKLKPWVRGGYFRGTGDGDPDDETHGTFFQVLPTPRIYARFPFYNLMNNEDGFVQLRLKPHAQLSVRTDLRYLRLSSSQDLWYLGGGAFQNNTFGFIGRPSGGSRTVGTLGDLSVDYSVTPTTAVTFYVAGVSGGRVQAFVYPEGGTHPGARFLFVELTQRF